MSQSEWRELPKDGRWETAMQIAGSTDIHVYIRGPVRCIVSRDGPERLWHISISCESRYPSWEELKKARYDLLPDEITMAMFLPPKAEYVNIHPNCFHWHEFREPHLIVP